MKRATLILGLRHGVFVDRFIFRFTSTGSAFEEEGVHTEN